MRPLRAAVALLLWMAASAYTDLPLEASRDRSVSAAAEATGGRADNILRLTGNAIAAAAARLL